MDRSFAARKWAFEQLARSLVGRQIERVTYVERDEEVPWPREGAYFDSLDVGLTLALAGGGELSLSCGAEFCCCGVSLKNGPLAAGARSREAGARWRDLLGRAIADVAVVWEPGDDDSEDFEYPQEVQLRFAGGGEITVAAFETRGKMNHVTVFFGPSGARR